MHIYIYEGDPSELELLDEGIVHRFGNLCLISCSKNSELSNHSADKD